MFYTNYKRSLSFLDTVLKPSKWIPHIANKLEINGDYEDKRKTMISTLPITIKIHAGMIHTLKYIL